MPGPHKPSDLKRFVAFGSSVGIEISGKNLEVTAVRVRPNGIEERLWSVQRRSVTIF